MQLVIMARGATGEAKILKTKPKLDSKVLHTQRRLGDN
ncbi:hypothetical protein M5D96_007083 [Drosophila gunungcola]|uniref:Uncharacterized protein n=1 Tax=Drosophila gunungcola TaxID=103775 RepID=A0A9P9YMD6_9MUSC|nr:hypothetical protein M5D96_007083 [Drosophila gunungcola]